MNRLAVVGTGPSALYLLQNMVAHAATLRDPPLEISFFEKSAYVGAGMPYNLETTDHHHQSNISSEELPALPETFADWLRNLSDKALCDYGIDREEISDSAIYSRLALGGFFRAQFRTLVERCHQLGWAVAVHERSEVVDIGAAPDKARVWLEDDGGKRHCFDRVVIATGHVWPRDDVIADGYYRSPWPIYKLLPGAEDEFFNFEVGLLGASLSAFDVVNTLAHWHGQLIRTEEGQLVYQLNSGAEGFQLVLHSSRGLLPHLQYEQVEPMRAIYRHASRREILHAVDDSGFLRLDAYFDQICRAPLLAAARKDQYSPLVELLEDPSAGWTEFVEFLSGAHDCGDAFERLREELPKAIDSVRGDHPIHWKETLDDLIYCLNYHTELLAAEDHVKLHAEIMPFLFSVIAAMPLHSARVLLALRAAGVIRMVKGKVEVVSVEGQHGRTIIEVDDGDGVEAKSFRMFVDCRGQSVTEVDDYPFPSLIEQGYVVPARARLADPAAMADEAKIFREGQRRYYQNGGVWIDSSHRLLNAGGLADSRLYDLSYPHVMGVRPYSYGLQACNETARIVVESWTEESVELAADCKLSS